MKKYLIILLFQSIINSASSQNGFENRDSLKQLLSHAKEDTVRQVLLAKLSGLYIYNNPDSALKYCNLMLQLSQQLNDRKAMANAHQILSDVNIVRGNYSRAMYNILEAAKMFRLAGDTLSIIDLNSQLAEIYYEIGDYKKALMYDHTVRYAIETQADPAYSHQTPHFKKRQMMYAKTALASDYLLGNILDSALIFGREAFAIDRELNLFWSYTSLVMGNVFLKLNKPDSALKYYRSLIKIPAQNDQVDINIGIATVFYMRNQVDSGSYYARMALDSARYIHYLKGIMKASEVLSGIFEITKPAEAIRYFKISSDAKDSLYNREKMDEVSTLIASEDRRVEELREAELNYRNKLRMITLITLSVIFLIIGILLYRNNQHRKKAYLLLSDQKKETDIQKAKVESALEELKSTQSQLIQSEKMASLGELTAGIAHEIQNPLNFVNNFSEVNSELLDEMKEAIRNGNYVEVEKIAEDIQQNEGIIMLHGKRADGIVKSMLQHSQSNSGQKELTDINKLADEYLRLAYHGLRSKDNSFNATMKTDFDPSIKSIKVIPQEIGRVLLNLYNNAFHAVNEKKKAGIADFEPTVWISSKKNGTTIEVTVRDNGNGIAEKYLEKIFQPFFTTKPTGQGTGLGLSLSYDIVKAHGGEILVHNFPGNGAEFVVSLPVEKAI